MSLFLLTFLLGLSAASVNFTTVFEWNPIDYVWPSEDFRQRALRKGDYVHTKFYPLEHVVYGDRVFISILKSGNYPSPFTLSWLPTTASSSYPKLNPFPTWIMHETGKCTTMQQIKGMVVDVCGRLWAVDRGNELCPAKLWIFDLTENDSVSLVHQFTNEIASHTVSKRYLKSLVLDETPNDTLAYIPDFTSRNMIVFSLKENVSWAIQIKDISISCIALSPTKGKELVYLGSTLETGLYSVPLSELRTRGRKSAVIPTLVGKKTAGSSRMLMDNKGKLYFDLKFFTYVGTWDTTAPFKEEELFKDERLSYFGFKFSFTFDTRSYLWIITREKGETTHFRLLRAYVGVKSYLYNDLIPHKGCGRISSNYPTKKYKPTELPQTSKTQFQVSKDNTQTTFQVISTGKSQTEKETYWSLSSPQTSKTEPFQDLKENSQTTVQYVSTEDPKPTKETHLFSLLEQSSKTVPFQALEDITETTVEVFSTEEPQSEIETHLWSLPPQTSKTVPFQVSKSSTQTTVQVFSTGKPHPEKEAFDEFHFNIALICLVVFIVILCCIIFWLKGLKKSINRIKV